MRSGEITAKKQRGRPFQPGRSANPSGRPKGARNRATLIAEALLNGEVEELTRKAVTLAKRGNVVCLRLCLDRLLPPKKDRPVQFQLGSIQSANGAAEAMAALLRGVANGEVSPTEAEVVSNLIETWLRAVAASDFERRLEALEGRNEERK